MSEKLSGSKFDSVYCVTDFGAKGDGVVEEGINVTL